MDNIEVWNKIDNFNNYEVSSFGNVRNKSKKNILKQQKDKKGYFNISLTENSIKKTFKVHCLVFNSFNKKLDPKLVIDHIDENKENNNISNLRLLTNRENCSRSKKNKSSQYTGVSYDKERKKWSAEIRNGLLKIKLGRFNSEIEAHNTYVDKLKEINNE